jgi:hypothetical protein
VNWLYVPLQVATHAGAWIEKLDDELVAVF